MMYELVETYNGRAVVTTEFPAGSLAEAGRMAGDMMPRTPAWVREKKHAEESDSTD